MVQSLDENVGRLIDTIDELKLTEKTIIVFFSDNGVKQFAGVAIGGLVQQGDFAGRRHARERWEAGLHVAV